MRDAISGELAAHGMGHLPEELPAYQEMGVWILRLGTPIAGVVNAVTHPAEWAGGRQAADLLPAVAEQAEMWHAARANTNSPIET